MNLVVVLAQTRKQEKLKATLDVVLLELELCLDFVELSVFQLAKFESVVREMNPGVVKPKLADAAEKAGLQDHFNVETVLHALEIFGRILYCH